MMKTPTEEVPLPSSNYFLTIRTKFPLDPLGKENIRTLLGLYSSVQVTFEKVDGTLRTMNCTLRPEAMPTFDHPTPSDPPQANTHVCTVYDLDKKEWRSFRYASVREVIIEKNET